MLVELFQLNIILWEKNVVSSEASNGLPSELLYTDDLVLMAPAMEQLGRCVAEYFSVT